MQHLAAYGMDRDAPRVATLVQDTAPVPLVILEASMRLSRQQSTGNFPPTAGQVIDAGLTICHESDPARYRNPNGGRMRKPNWYRQLARIKFNRSLEISPSH